MESAERLNMFMDRVLENQGFIRNDITEVKSSMKKIEDRITSIEGNQAKHQERIGIMQNSITILQREIKDDKEDMSRRFDKTEGMVVGIQKEYVTIDSMKNALFTLENQIKAQMWKSFAKPFVGIVITLLTKIAYDAIK